MEKSGYANSVVPNAWLDLTSKMPFLSSMAGHDAHSILDSHGLSSLHVSSGGRLWYTFSASPTSAGQTTFTCQVYLNWPGDNAQADAAIDAIKDEVQSLLSGAKAPATPAAGLQSGILADLTSHLKAERKTGKEVWPASRESTVSAKYSQADLRKSPSHTPPSHPLPREEAVGDRGGVSGNKPFRFFFLVLTNLATVCKQLSCLKPKTAPDMGLWGKLGSRNELDW